MSRSVARVRTVAQMAHALDVLVDHGFVAHWQRIDGRYWIETGGTDGPYSQRQASAWIDGAAAMGAGGRSLDEPPLSGAVGADGQHTPRGPSGV